MNSELKGRVGIVTGAYGHLGTAVSTSLAGSGAHVLLWGRDADKLSTLADELASAGGQASTFAFDLLDGAARRSVFDDIEERFGRIDFIVNNAYAGRTGTIESASATDFDDTYRVAVTTAFEIVQTALPLMRKAVAASGGTASIINVASMYGTVSPDPRLYGESGQNSPPYYGAAKAALIQLTRYLACHLGEEAIRANVVSPGPFPATHAGAIDPDFLRRLSAKVPMGRVGRPEEVGSVIAFLASEAASYINGANIPVDGGWTAW